MTDRTLCPVCEQGALHEYSEQVEMEYHGEKTMLPSLFSVCDYCNAEQATPQQTKHNKRAMIAFKKQVDGLLSGQQVRDLRKRLGLKQSQAAAIFGGGPVAFSKYESDDVMQSEPMDKLLRVATDIPDAYFYLTAKAGIEPIACGSQWTEIAADTVATDGPHLRLVRNNVWETTDIPRYA